MELGLRVGMWPRFEGSTFLLGVRSMSELKGDKKILLLPGSHEISIRQVGYADLTHVIVVEPGTVNPFYIKLAPNNAAQYPGKDAAELKLNIRPKRAAVFLDDGYAGDAGHFGGANTMLV